MEIKRGDVYFVYPSFPTGCEIKKGRPAVVVSANRLNRNGSVVEVVYLTTQPKKECGEHVTLDATGVESTALCEQISTVSVDRLSDYMTHLDSKTLDAIERGCLYSLGLEKYAKNVVTDTSETQSTELTKVMAERDTYKALYTELLQKVMDK
jgi:mRNA interferase MazF